MWQIHPSDGGRVDGDSEGAYAEEGVVYGKHLSFSLVSLVNFRVLYKIKFKEEEEEERNCESVHKWRKDSSPVQWFCIIYVDTPPTVKEGEPDPHPLTVGCI